MKMKRNLASALGAVFAFGLLSHAHAQYALPTVTSYKSPTCGCCGEWEKHMRANGFKVTAKNVSDMTSLKRTYGVPQSLSSCHTARVGDYLIEGHVPAEDVKRLVRERPKVAGIAVPGMPMGSPGMEQGAPVPYATIAFGTSGTSVFARH
jgi:hypothetical protein